MMKPALTILSVALVTGAGCGKDDGWGWGSWGPPPVPANDVCPPPQQLYSCPISTSCLGGPRTVCPTTCCGSDPYSAQANCLLQFTSGQNARAVDPPGCTPVSTTMPQGDPDPVTVAVGAGAGGGYPDPSGAGGDNGAGGASDSCACGDP